VLNLQKKEEKKDIKNKKENTQKIRNFYIEDLVCFYIISGKLPTITGRNPQECIRSSMM